MDASITQTKSAFLRAQVRLLSTPPQPSSETLPAKPLADVLARLDAKLKSHCRLVFSVQSQRHVAEQIDALYWSEIHNNRGDVGTVYVPRDADLSDTRIVKGLEGAVEGDEYEEVRRKLESRAEYRDQLRERVEMYRGLRRGVAAFEGPDVNVQRNLVTRDGEVAVELERLKVLVARVVAGLGQGVGGGQEMGEAELSEQQRLQRVIEMD